MQTDNPKCPDQQTLLQFIQGRLEPPTLDQCEDHLSDCQLCHETLRGLDTNDTLSHYVSDALEQALPGFSENPSDTQAIDGLMNRLLQPTRSSNRVPGVDAEIMADRAAEVLRCVEPAAIGDDDSLGTLGDYRLLRLIGAGGTGVVFQAKDVSLDRVVALKVLRPSLGNIARDRFIAEARLAASIEHDNVVTIYQIGQEGRLAFIAMQWLPGETLEARLNRQSDTLDEVTIREFVTQIASGLSAAHQRQMIHRDIKPANIWICDDTGRIKILDFGLARVADEESSLTQTGMLAGTPSFMSPEQTKGMELDPRSDLFSLGCVMYKLLTGRLPFSAPTVLGTLQTIQSDSPQPPIEINPNCNADLSDLTMSLLEKLPGNRLASAENLIHSLASNRSNWPQVIPKIAGALSEPSAAAPATAKKNGVRTWLAAAVLLSFLAVPAWLLAPQIYRIATNQGELVIETSDENIKVQVLKNGKEVNVLDSSTGNSIEIAAGEYTFNATKEGSESEFEITPKSVTMTRGGRELVSVTMALQDKKHLASDNKTKLMNMQIKEIKSVCIAYKLQVGHYPKTLNDLVTLPDGMTNSQWSGPYFEDAVLPKDPWNNPFLYSANDTEDKLFVSSSGPEGSTADKSEERKFQLDARIAELKVQKDELVQSVGNGHPDVQSIEKRIESISRHLGPLVSSAEGNIPIYGGRNFEQWFSIARNDREPKTVADAIAACGFLADEDRSERFIDLLRDLVRQHGAANCIMGNGGEKNSTNILFTGFVKGICKLEPKEVVEFIQFEANSGNERSLGFCSSLYHNVDFDGNNTKRLEFFNRLKLSMSHLFSNISKHKIKVDLDTQSFLEAYFNKKITKHVDVRSCKSVINELKVDQRPQIYRIFMNLFDEGEFDKMVARDFFGKSTSGETREEILWILVEHHDRWRFAGGGGGGGIAPQATVPNHIFTLSNQLLMRAITELVDSNDNQLEFKTFSDIQFDDEGIVNMTITNGVVQWLHSDDRWRNTKPKDCLKISGRAAIIRHLLTKLIQDVSRDSYAGEDKDKILAFVKEMTQSNKSFKELASTADFKELQIDRDLRSLRDFVKGDEDDVEFGRFVTRRSGGSFGGGGGGGVF